MLWLILITGLALCVSTVVILLIVGQRSTSTSTLMSVIGSGGHTTEMLSLIKSVTEMNQHTNDIDEIVFVVSKSDTKSQNKLLMEYSQLQYPEQVDQSDDSLIKYRLLKITRSRDVHQSYFTSLFTTMFAIIESLSILYTIKPSILICNGPGVCIPLVIASRLLTPKTNIIFVESFCRTRTLSLSGKILYHFHLVHHFLVQWPKLAQKYSRAQYIGLLV